MSENYVDTPENWDASSEAYASKVAPILMETFAQEFCTMLNPNENDEVLEVAAGSGALTKHLCVKVKSLLATDFSPNMLNLNKQSLNKSELLNTSFKIMDGQALDLESESFDKAVCMFGLMLFADRAKGFSELYRVLRPNGKVLVSGWAEAEYFDAFGLFLKGLNKAFPDMPKEQSPPILLSLSNLEIFKDEMQAAGFINIEVKFVTRELILNNFEEFWILLTAGTPPAKVLFNKIGVHGHELLRKTMAIMIKEEFGEGSITLKNSATVATGNK